MQLNIKSDEAYRLARELSRLTDESMTEAVRRALDERLQKEQQHARRRRAGFSKKAAALAARLQALPVRDDRAGDEILYDADGLPR